MKLIELEKQRQKARDARLEQTLQQATIAEILQRRPQVRQALEQDLDAHIKQHGEQDKPITWSEERAVFQAHKADFSHEVDRLLENRGARRGRSSNTFKQLNSAVINNATGHPHNQKLYTDKVFAGFYNGMIRQMHQNGLRAELITQPAYAHAVLDRIADEYRQNVETGVAPQILKTTGYARTPAQYRELYEQARALMRQESRRPAERVVGTIAGFVLDGQAKTLVDALALNKLQQAKRRQKEGRKPRREF